MNANLINGYSLELDDKPVELVKSWDNLEIYNTFRIHILAYLFTTGSTSESSIRIPQHETLSLVSKDGID